MSLKLLAIKSTVSVKFPCDGFFFTLKIKVNQLHTQIRGRHLVKERLGKERRSVEMVVVVVVASSVSRVSLDINFEISVKGLILLGRSYADKTVLYTPEAPKDPLKRTGLSESFEREERK